MLFTLQKLPTLLPDYRNPCWEEDIPEQFTYQLTYYYKYDCQQQTSVRKQFDKLSKYYKHKTKRLRCYPYFYVIGAPKCGSTDFHKALTSYHPHIVSGARKESQFWVRRRHGITSSIACPHNTGETFQI